ncbi:MAG: NAD-dependent epimerase/dehydratase family protein [Ruminococcaceae bacterium]|nr:NAD-dependent epimerase/dehydratase family protein [Oscillospiraceae bacterium]
MSMFADKTLLITGGTGSFGRAVLNRVGNMDLREIRIFSRDEEKQNALRHELQVSMPEASDRIRFYIADVRDPQSLKYAMKDVDMVFHAAALKQVPSCEFFPMEAVKTNVIGTENLLNAAVDAGVERVICLSTDKAAYPVNAMGLSKALMEKIAVSKARSSFAGKTSICCTRYGNVLCSRGSVIPLWIEQIRAGKPVTLTNPEMTRFIMTLDEAINLVLCAFEQGKSGDIWVQKAPACTIDVLARATRLLFDPEGRCEIKTIGTRHGEKLYETLLTNEECARAEDKGGYYRVPCDSRDLNYEQFFDYGNVEHNAFAEFNSLNTRLLTVDEVKEILLTLPYIRGELAKDGRV